MNLKVAILLLFMVFCHAQMDVPILNCGEPQFYDADDGLQRLKLTLDQSISQMDRLQKDVQELRQLQTLAKKGMEEEAQISFIEVHSLQYLSTLKHKFESLNLIQIQDHQTLSNLENIKQQIDQTLQAADPQTRKDCCQMLCTMIESLILNLLQQEQEYLKPITINFSMESKQIQIMRGECDATTISTQKAADQSLDSPLTEVNDTGYTFVSEDDQNNDIVDSAFSSENPAYNFEHLGENDLLEYGYSYWFRFLTRYPRPMYGGKSQSWYFLSRLSPNKINQNAAKGDRLLALFQGQNKYTFVTNDYKTSNWNLAKDVQCGDIEGVWTFVHFSYSMIAKKAIGFMKFSGNDPIQVTFEAIHDQPLYLRLTIGGNDLGHFQALNGQYSKGVFKYGESGTGAYIANPTDLNNYVQEHPEPTAVTSETVEEVLIPQSKNFNMKQAADPEFSSTPSLDFPLEYSISGWFKWQEIAMQNWHLVYRFHINKDSENQNSKRLGDRALAVFCSPQLDGIYAFTTYSYSGLSGGGNTNVNKNVPQKQQQTSWHFIFYGYNRELRRAEGYIQFQGRKEVIIFEGVNHFLAPQVYLNVGRDRFLAGYNGQIGKFRMNLGVGAFEPELPSDISIPPALIEIRQPEVTEAIEIEDQEIEITNLKISRYDEVTGQEYLNNDEPIIPRLIGQNQGLP